MKVKYELTVQSNCPVDYKGDIYNCCLTSDKPIPVETILEAIKKYNNEFLFQENIAEELSRDLCCVVELVGYHSGVKVTVIA